MLRSSHDRTLELDLELARRQSAENPVYYVQYAHARIASMLRRLTEERVGEAVALDDRVGKLQSSSASERELIKKLASFPGGGRGGGAPAGPAPDHPVLARAGPRLHRFL